MVCNPLEEDKELEREPGVTSARPQAYMPTPEEIDLAAEIIREGWSDSERAERKTGRSLP